jgi:hypothetical protein
MKPRIFWIRVSVLLLLYNIIEICHNLLQQPLKQISHCYQKDSLSHLKKNINFCNSSNDTRNVKIKFSSQIVNNEYIVTFNGYYKKETRKNFIKAALTSSGITDWKIISRNNLASKYPSDFDIVQIKASNRKYGIDALESHPLIQGITSQKVVHRTLKYVKTNEDEFFPKYKSFRRKINNNVY